MESMVINGQVVQGERVGVVTQNEQWSEWILEDGTVLRAKPVLVKVLRHAIEAGATYAYAISNVTDLVAPVGKATGE